jgi:hypothetical protein
VIRTAGPSVPIGIDGGAGNNALWVDLRAAAGPDGDYLSANTVHSNLLGDLYYQATGGVFGGLAVTLGNGGNKVSVLGTAAGTSTLLQTGAGNDTVAVTSPQGLLNTLAGALTIDEGGGSNWLYVSEANRATGDSWFLNEGSIAGDSFALRYMATGGAFAGVQAFGGNGNDVFTVLGQTPGLPTTLFGDGGNDLFQVAVKPGSDYSNLTADGGAGSDVLSVVDQAGGAIMHTQPTGAGQGQIAVQYVNDLGSVVAYRNLEGPLPSVSPDQSYIQVLYLSHLGRSASPGEVATWQKVLAAGGRQAVVQGLLASAEARQYLVNQWYAQYLGTGPDANAGALVNLLASQPQEMVLATFLAGPAYLAKSGNTPDGFARRLFVDLLGRAPSDAEVKQTVLQVTQRNGYQGAALSVLTAPEYRARSVDLRYEQLLHRDPSAQELSAWVNSGLGQNQITLIFETTDEFYNAAV